MSYQNMNSELKLWNSDKNMLSTLLLENDISPTSQSISQIVGDFLIGEKLGEGTFSKVCQGIHQVTKEKVAIKILQKYQIKEEDDKLRIEKEINIQKKLRHNNIIQQYCILETISNIYIVTEYCSGGELFDHIVSKTKLCEYEACRIFQQLIAGLEYLHKQKIVHRDLKPENLLFDSKRELKIADFGLSSEYDGKLSTPCGSPCYAAPEMVSGKKYDGMPVDIWSAGIVLYTMVCGHLPFEDDNQHLLFNKIAKGIFSISTHLSTQCKDLIKLILVTDPETRLTFDQIKTHPWFIAINSVIDKNIFFRSPGLFINKDVIPLDKELINQLINSYNYDLKEIITDVIMNKHSAITTSYYLLLKKKVKNGDASISDISFRSELFFEYITSSISKLSYFSNNLQKIVSYYYQIIAKQFPNKSSIELPNLNKLEKQLTSSIQKENTLPNPIRRSLISFSCRINNKKRYHYPSIQFDKFINKKRNCLNNKCQNRTTNHNKSKEYKDDQITLNVFLNNDNRKHENDRYNAGMIDKKNSISMVNKQNFKLKTDQNTSSFDQKKDKSILNEENILETRESIPTERNCYHYGYKKKKFSLDSSLNSNSGQTPEKTPQQRFLNTSIILENQNNSSTSITSYSLQHKNAKINLRQSMRKGKVFNNPHKITHYSQDIEKGSDIGIASFRNTGSSFICSNNQSMNKKTQIKLNNYQKYCPIAAPDMRQSIPISYYKQKIDKLSSIQGNYKKIQVKRNNLRLKKFINIIGHIDNKQLSPKNKQSNSVEVKNRMEQRHSILNNGYQQRIILSREKDLINNQTRLHLNICCKKTMKEIKEAISSIVGKHVVIKNLTVRIITINTII